MIGDCGIYLFDVFFPRPNHLLRTQSSSPLLHQQQRVSRPHHPLPLRLWQAALPVVARDRTSCCYVPRLPVERPRSLSSSLRTGTSASTKTRSRVSTSASQLGANIYCKGRVCAWTTPTWIPRRVGNGSTWRRSSTSR